MDEKIIKKIVEDVFQKAKKEHASHSKFALSNHISIVTNLSSKTLERAHDRYIGQRKKHGSPQGESIELLCKYLNYVDYEDYVKHNVIIDSPKEKNTPQSKKRKWSLTIKIIVVFGAILVVSSITKSLLNLRSNENTGFELNQSSPKHLNFDPSKDCMAWADSLYVSVSCDKGPFSEYGTKVEPLNRSIIFNLKKIDVNAATIFFSEETEQPLVWYHKSKDGTLEYFSAPGVHPITGKTLKAITTYIIDRYVPIHSDKEDSFVE